MYGVSKMPWLVMNSKRISVVKGSVREVFCPTLIWNFDWNMLFSYTNLLA